MAKNQAIDRAPAIVSRPPDETDQGGPRNPGPDPWSYVTDDQGRWLDEYGNPTVDPKRAVRKWRQTKLPAPVGPLTTYVVTLDLDRAPGMVALTMFGMGFGAFVMRPNAADPRNPTREFMRVSLAANQLEAIQRRGKEDFVWIPAERDETGGIAVDDNGQPKRPGAWVPKGEILQLVPLAGDLAAIGAGYGSIELAQRLERLEAENKMLRASQQPGVAELSPDEAVRLALYAAQMAKPGDSRPIEELLMEAAESVERTRRHFPERTPADERTPLVPETPEKADAQAQAKKSKRP